MQCVRLLVFFNYSSAAAVNSSGGNTKKARKVMIGLVKFHITCPGSSRLL
jgi:hypothetical protein